MASKKVEIAYVIVNSYFDKLVQRSYTLSTQNQATASLWACLAMPVTLTITLFMNSYHVINGDVEITSGSKELK